MKKLLPSWPSLPAGLVAASETFHYFAPHFFQQVPDHVEADAGTFLLQVGHAEFAGLPLDGVEDKSGFRSARAFDLAGALFKLGARAADDGEKEIQPRG